LIATGTTLRHHRALVPTEKHRRKLSLNDPLFKGEKGSIDVTDDEIRESIENNQLKLQQERGTDLTIFSPRASWMGHHVGNEWTSLYWTQHQNDIIKRVCDLFPKNFAPVAQLPQSPGSRRRSRFPRFVGRLRNWGSWGSI
jgi:4-oxalmesaconate hydratase